MTGHAELRALYDAQLRAEAEVADAQEVTRIGPLWLGTYPAGTGRRGFVSYAGLGPGDDVEALIAAAVAHFGAMDDVDAFEWKTRGHDPVPDLLDRLRAHGFAVEEVETVMAGPAEAVASIADPLPPGYRVEHVVTDDDVREAERVARGVFGDPGDLLAGLGDELVARLARDPDALEMWVARAPSGEVVCSGRVDFVAGTPFAGLWGGACQEAHRGRGLYRALTAERARSALRRGKLYLQSDCTEKSRPILERAGLVAITTTTPARWHRPGSTSPAG